MEPTPLCPGCGKALEANAPQGLCQKCLLEAGFPTGTDTAGASPHFVPPAIDELGTKFPQLEILEFVGQGGMGAVYQARQKQLDRIVALKILPPKTAAGPGFSERFTREARALARLNHPHIVTLYEFGQADGLYYFLMEFVDGLNLRQVFKAGRVSPKEALAIVPQICDALQYAHERGIVHRDIKPENILLSRDGQVKIADFGVAKIMGEISEEARRAAAQSTDLTQTGSALGTPQYMAPEQLRNSAEVDHRADIYSLGVVFYQMLTGELPSGQLESPSRRVAIDVRLDEVVLRALEQDPERRYQQVSEVKERVETIAQTPASSNRPRGKARTTRVLAKAALIAGALVLLVALGFWMGSPRSPAPQPKVAVEGKPAEHSASVLIETWAPTLEPGEQPNLQNILDAAKDLTEKGQYESALQRRIWYFNHALETGDSYQRIVRRSSSFIDWAELGRRYPKARQALLEIRDRDAEKFAAGNGYFELFMELSAINRDLQQDDATVAVFKSIQSDKKLAQGCFPMVNALLVQRGEYDLCMRYISSPEAVLETSHENWERMTQMERSHEAMRQRQAEQFEALRKTNAAMASVPTPILPGPPKLADRNFVEQICQLIETLVGVGRRAEAEKIRDQALATLDNARLKSTVTDAEERIKAMQSTTNRKKQI